MDSTTSTTAAVKCRMLMLLAELRLRIYEEVIFNHGISYVRVYLEQFKDHDYTPPLLNTCTQIRCEAEGTHRSWLKDFHKKADPSESSGRFKRHLETMAERLRLIAAMEAAKLYGDH